MAEALKTRTTRSKRDNENSKSQTPQKPATPIKPQIANILIRDVIDRELKSAIDPLNEQIRLLETCIETQKNNFTAEIQSCKNDIINLRADLMQKEVICNSLKLENEKLRSKVVNLEMHARRGNLKFLNIPEEKGENCEQKIINILHSRKFMIPPRYIARAHRLGPFKPTNNTYPRPIIVKFEMCKDREIIFQNRHVFRGVTNKYHAKIVVDKININGRQYGVENLSDLPDDLNLEKVYTKENNTMLDFYTKKHYF